MKTFSFISLFIFTCVFVQCGGDSSTSTATTAADATTSESAQTLPADLVLSSPTAANSSVSTSISGLVRTAVNAGDADGEDYVAKKEALQTLIAGEGECSFTIDVNDSGPPHCYGPTLDWQNHPNGTGGSGQLPGGDLMIWDETNMETDNEACAAAQMNYEVDLVSTRVDNVINTIGSMACAGKKADITLPEITETPLDMKDEMTEQVPVEGLGVEVATIDRLEDDEDGNEQYESTLNVTFALQNGQTAAGKIILRHIPLDDTNSTYKGKLSFIFSDPALTSFNCNELSASEGTTVAGTIVYQKTSETDLKYDMESAQFCGTDVDPFDENNDISFTDTVSATNTDGWGDNGLLGRIAFNPATNVGTFQYAWQAGYGDGATRVFNLVTTAGVDGTINGDAYAGFGPAIQDRDPTINGFICNWAGPGQTKGVGGSVDPDPLTQYQKIRRATDETVFSSSSTDLAITFAPTNDCNYNGSGSFKYNAADAERVMTNDNLTGVAVTNDLLPLSTYQSDFTPLEALTID